MATFFRIVQERWAASAMSGEGARRHGGRWNPPGLLAVYLAESRALAALEIIVHAPREVLRLDWRIIEVEVPDSLIEEARLSRLPADWRAQPSSQGARRFGGDWLRSVRAPALRLPSVIIPSESTLMVNPLHLKMAALKHSLPGIFSFDARL